MPLQDFCVLGPQAFVCKAPWNRTSGCICVSEVPGISQHVTPLLTSAFKLSYEFQNIFLIKELFEHFFSLLFLQADEDPIMGFHQMFLLKNINDAWVCTNDMFRLALHNFG